MAALLTRPSRPPSWATAAAAQASIEAGSAMSSGKPCTCRPRSRSAATERAGVHTCVPQSDVCASELPLIALPALGLALWMILFARPLSVMVGLLPFKAFHGREKAFIAWVGLRGAVPIVFTTIPLSEGVEGAERLFDIVFVMVVVYTLLTGPTLPLVARVLKVTRRGEPRDLELEAAPLERVAADLLQVTISP
eukprot:gene33146-37451_t